MRNESSGGIRDTVFLIGILTKSEGQNSIPPKQAFQTALTLKGHYHHFHNFTVLFQPHSVKMYTEHTKH